MTFNDAEIARADRAPLARLDKNNTLPVVLMLLDPENDREQPWLDDARDGKTRPVN